MDHPSVSASRPRDRERGSHRDRDRDRDRHRRDTPGRHAEEAQYANEHVPVYSDPPENYQPQQQYPQQPQQPQQGYDTPRYNTYPAPQADYPQPGSPPMGEFGQGYGGLPGYYDLHPQMSLPQPGYALRNGMGMGGGYGTWNGGMGMGMGSSSSSVGMSGMSGVSGMSGMAGVSGMGSMGPMGQMGSMSPQRAFSPVQQGQPGYGGWFQGYGWSGMR